MIRWKFRDRARRFYSSNATQCCVAFIILASYISAMYRSQTLPAEDSTAARNLDVLEWIFTMLFLAELIINMAAHWFVKFYHDPWNLFDFVVVVMSLLGLGWGNLPAITVLRLMRVFKILRLFQKLQSLRILITALADSVVPVLNSMVILLLFTSMYAVVATDLFHTQSEEFFGTFGASLYTLFQISTMDAWSSIVTRTLLEEFESYQGGWVMLFFVSYVLLVGLVLMNIVVAVLLDEFISTVAREKVLLLLIAVEPSFLTPSKTFVDLRFNECISASAGAGAATLRISSFALLQLLSIFCIFVLFEKYPQVPGKE